MTTQTKPQATPKSTRLRRTKRFALIIGSGVAIYAVAASITSRRRKSIERRAKGSGQLPEAAPESAAQEEWRNTASTVSQEENLAQAGARTGR